MIAFTRVLLLKLKRLYSDLSHHIKESLKRHYRTSNEGTLSLFIEAYCIIYSRVDLL